MATTLTIRYARKDPDGLVGVLLDPQGNPLFRHFSSSVDFLKADLTTTFVDRREALESLYPDGYDLVVEEVTL